MSEGLAEKVFIAFIPWLLCLFGCVCIQSPARRQEK